MFASLFIKLCEKNKSMVFTQNIDEHVCWDVNLKQRKLITSDSLVRMALIFYHTIARKEAEHTSSRFQPKILC